MRVGGIWSCTECRTPGMQLSHMVNKHTHGRKDKGIDEQLDHRRRTQSGKAVLGLENNVIKSSATMFVNVWEFETSACKYSSYNF